MATFRPKLGVCLFIIHRSYHNVLFVGHAGFIDRKGVPGSKLRNRAKGCSLTRCRAVPTVAVRTSEKRINVTKTVTTKSLPRLLKNVSRQAIADAKVDRYQPDACIDSLAGPIPEEVVVPTVDELEEADRNATLFIGEMKGRKDASTGFRLFVLIHFLMVISLTSSWNNPKDLSRSTLLATPIMLTTTAILIKNSLQMRNRLRTGKSIPRVEGTKTWEMIAHNLAIAITLYMDPPRTVGYWAGTIMFGIFLNGIFYWIVWGCKYMAITKHLMNWHESPTRVNARLKQGHARMLNRETALFIRSSLKKEYDRSFCDELLRMMWGRKTPHHLN